ncbi:HAD family hydrolase [uncultured Paraburkholderia sp.]|uniref:HAD family hydrolase n=1 Tax=uncultured Paraburkholderia sp. TaxID=1822466 RepID=UPI00259A90AE|nr:HAD family hydrolase [uncultured Paraburkholderia sp.]
MPAKAFPRPSPGPFTRLFAMPSCGRPFPDCEAVLRTLRVAGIATGIVSNIGWNILPCLAANRMTGPIDTVVQSFRAGRLKPDGEMFLAVLRNLRIEPARALMVGDNWRTDGAAAAVGIATLVLPVSPANRRHRGLDIVLRMAGIELLLRKSCATPG